MLLGTIFMVTVLHHLDAKPGGSTSVAAARLSFLIRDNKGQNEEI